MRVDLTINEKDLREAINDANEDQRKDMDPNRLTLDQVKAKLKDPEFLAGATEELMASAIHEALA